MGAGAARPLRRGLAVLLAVCLLACGLGAGGGRAERDRRRAAAVRMADFILARQRENGAVADAADADTVNEDSNMEYALIALAAAYRRTGAPRYLSGLERGIAWLAAAETMDGGSWTGSWRYRYDSGGAPLPAPDGCGAADVRGVDATGALFVYLLYLHRQCAGTAALAAAYRDHAAAALRFLLTRSRTAAGFFASSFRQDGSGAWRRWDCCYAADQGDVWLGLRAGALLYGDEACAQAADFLRREVPRAFFSAARGRYCTALEDGQQDWSAQGFDPIQSQGFLPWLWGGTAPNRAAVRWLRRRMDEGRPDEYSLTAAFLALGERGLGAPSGRAAAWLLANGWDRDSGGVFDARSDRTETVNTAAFGVLALLDWPAGL